MTNTMPRWVAALLISGTALLVLVAFRQEVSVAKPTPPDFQGPGVHPSQLFHYTTTIDLPPSSSAVYPIVVPNSGNGLVATCIAFVSGASDQAPDVVLDGQKLFTLHNGVALSNVDQRINDLPGGLRVDTGSTLSLEIGNPNPVNENITVTVLGYTW
jgi:hypothetical protein